MLFSVVIEHIDLGVNWIAHWDLFVRDSLPNLSGYFEVDSIFESTRLPGMRVAYVVYHV